MPRRQASRSSLATEDDAQPQHINTQAKHTAQRQKPSASARSLTDILGGNPEFADKFFGEPSNMQRNPYGDADGDVEMSLAGGRSAHDADHAHAFNNVGPSNGSMGGGPVNANSPVPLNTGNSIITIENTPYDIDVLIINQLEEDLDAYRYDLDFCRAQLEPSNANTISPAEQRTWQLRVLDLGHQMRMLNHRIQLMKASMNNARVVGGLAGKVGATTTNAYYGPYPPGTSIQPNAYGTPGGSMVQGYGGAPMGGTQYHPIQPYHPAGGSGYTGYTGYPEPPQERRGPGRPPGSKNRPRASLDPNQPPVLAPSGSAKAAALASAGAKRDLPNEIRVATPNGNGPSSSATAAAATSDEKLAKRPRLDVQVGSPLSNTTEDDNTSHARNNGVSAGKSDVAKADQDDATEDENEYAVSSFTTVNKKPKASSSVLAAPAGVPSTPMVGPANNSVSISSPSGGPAGPNSAPRGATYTRLGHWMCTLCTSQKYLQHPGPKQPSEPSNWPLRDISKIVTHFTRMHAEHNNIERCMELGAALETNKGPFRYWIQVTKKTKVDDAGVDAALTELSNGMLPDLLRKLSSSAKQFPPQK